MNKGYIVNESLDAVKGKIEALLSSDTRAFFNPVFNSARGNLADGTYVQFNWKEKDGAVILTIDARSATLIEKIYELFCTPVAEEAPAAEEAE